MAEIGNQYHDDKGHFTSEQNDGGACYHEFGSIKSKSAKEKYLSQKGFEKIRGGGYYREEKPYVDEFGHKHQIYARYKDGDIFFSTNTFDEEKEGYKTYNDIKKKLESEYSLEQKMKPYEWIQKEDHDKYEKIKEQKAQEFKRRVFDNDAYSFDYEPKSDFLKEMSEAQKNGAIRFDELIGSKGKTLRATNVHLLKFAEKHLDDFDDLKTYFLVNDADSYSITGDAEQDLIDNINKKVDEKADDYRERRLSKMHKDEQENEKLSYLSKTGDYDIFKKGFDTSKFSDENITQGTRVGGYSGYSQSNSAIESKEQGSMPLSQWTKERIISYLNRSKELKPYIDIFKKMSLAKLKDNVLRSDGWHHTSKFYNKTDFYSVDSPQAIINSVINDKQKYDFLKGLKKGFGIK